MLATLLSSTLVGLDGRIIRVEVDVAPGLPGFTIVGLADAALQEARERVRGAIRNAGFSHPPRRITVNLAPADLRKAGASLDLAIAIGILLGSEQVTAAPGRIALIGELSLGGEVASVPGILPMAAALARRGVRRLIVSADAVAEASLVDGIEIGGVRTLREAADLLRRRPRHAARPAPPRIELADAGLPSEDVAGSAAPRTRPARPRSSPTSPRSAASWRRDGPSRSRWRVATACFSWGRRGPARRSWPARSRACCRRSTTRRHSRRPSSRRSAGRGRSRRSAARRRSGHRTTRCPMRRWSAAVRGCRPAK